jgi:hypothetical protein
MLPQLMAMDVVVALIACGLLLLRAPLHNAGRDGQQLGHGHRQPLQRGVQVKGVAVPAWYRAVHTHINGQHQAALSATADACIELHSEAARHT